MKKTICFGMVLFIICTLSCSKKTINANIENKVEAQKSIAEAIKNDEERKYHANEASQNGIDAALLSKNWVSILVMTADKIKNYDKSNLQKDMVIFMDKDLNHDGNFEKIRTGTYKDADGNEGSFICILGQNNNLILNEIVKDEPILVHMRDVGDAVFFGTGYGSEYFRQISEKDGKIEITNIEAE